ncbi:MAG: hypothetical protein PHP11_00705 [Erysipelotrichaceae bacterium]|nr:hypothetical protein [Erysipelotrichaceae bacterium]MDD3923608.1 hypothetical protein [Erysipelotrichaceae bacterium]
MRKILTILLLLILLMGCSDNNESSDSIKLENYAYIYQTITDNDTFNTTTEHFDMNVVMSQIDDQNYRYDIIIDDPKVAMYDIKMMAVENNIDYSLANKMMPSIGIFDEEEYNMVPYQINTELGYVKGLIISGKTDAPVVNLKIRITWKDYTKVFESKEYFNLTVDYFSQNATFDNLARPSLGDLQQTMTMDIDDTTEE